MRRFSGAGGVRQPRFPWVLPRDAGLGRLGNGHGVAVVNFRVPRSHLRYIQSYCLAPSHLKVTGGNAMKGALIRALILIPLVLAAVGAALFFTGPLSLFPGSWLGTHHASLASAKFVFGFRVVSEDDVEKRLKTFADRNGLKTSVSKAPAPGHPILTVKIFGRPQGVFVVSNPKSEYQYECYFYGLGTKDETDKLSKAFRAFIMESGAFLISETYKNSPGSA